MVYSEEENGYCSNMFLDGLYSFFGGIYSTFSGSYNNDSTIVNSNSEISLSKISISSGEERYIKNAVEGKLVKGIEGQIAQEAWEDKCIQNLFGCGYIAKARERVENNNVADKAYLPYESRLRGNDSYMSYELYTEENSLSGSPYSVITQYSYEMSYITNESDEKAKIAEEKNIERYFKNHHSFEKNYLQTVEHENLPKEKTEFWKQRMQRLHDNEEEKTSA